MKPELTTEEDQMHAFAAGLLQGKEASDFIDRLHADPELAKDFILYYRKWRNHQPSLDVPMDEATQIWEKKVIVLIRRLQRRRILLLLLAAFPLTLFRKITFWWIVAAGIALLTAFALWQLLH